MLCLRRMFDTMFWWRLFPGSKLIWFVKFGGCWGGRWIISITDENGWILFSRAEVPRWHLSVLLNFHYSSGDKCVPSTVWPLDTLQWNHKDRAQLITMRVVLKGFLYILNESATDKSSLISARGCISRLICATLVFARTKCVSTFALVSNVRR